MYGKRPAKASLARDASRSRVEIAACAPRHQRFRADGAVAAVGSYFLPFSAFTAFSVWFTWSEASRLS